jgi:hypothetical protein
MAVATDQWTGLGRDPNARTNSFVLPENGIAFRREDAT